MQQLEIKIHHKTNNDSYDWVYCIECKKTITKVDNYHINGLKEALEKYNKDPDNNTWDIRYHYDYLMCDICKSNIDDLEQLDKNEEQEIEDRNNALEKEYLKNIRLAEPKKNKYCKIVNQSSYGKSTYSYKLEQWINQKSEQSYKFLCGQLYPLEYWTLATVTEEHLKHCGICKVLTGSKKKTGFTQYQVNELFKLGITDKSSSSKNFCSEGKYVYHYSTIEKMRLIDNTIVDNSQCWSAGFSHCESRLGECSLPLTSISSQIGDIETIRILDNKGRDTVLFTLKKEIKHYNDNDEYKTHEVIKRTFETRFYMFGNDENQDFLVELYDKPKTIKQAYESMKPLEAKTKKKILRQGDLFFIPTKEQFSEYSKMHYEDLPISLTYDQKEERDIYITQKLGTWILAKNDRFSKWNIRDATSRLLANNAQLEYISKFVKPKKELVRNKIFDTNHESQFMNIVNGNVYVKGQIIHTNRQHRKLVLNQWYQVVKNRVKESYTVQRFGSMGYD